MYISKQNIEDCNSFTGLVKEGYETKLCSQCLKNEVSHPEKLCKTCKESQQLC